MRTSREARRKTQEKAEKREEEIMGLLSIFGKGWVLAFIGVGIILNVAFDKNPAFVMLFAIAGLCVGYYVGKGD